MIKLVASDLDGTLLLGSADELNPEIYDIILKLKKHGITFVSASGRPLESQQKLFKPIRDEIFYIAENGAVYSLNGEISVISGVENELAYRIIDKISENPNCKILVSCPTKSYILDGDEDFLQYVREFVKLDVGLVKDFRKIQEPIVKFAYRDIDNWRTSSQYFRDYFQEEIIVITSGNSWVDFMPFGCSKGIALKEVLEKLNITPQETIAFGDQENDVEMLRFAGTGYAMAKAAPEAKACADAITDSVEKTLSELLKTLE